jgi:hypothetical protein
MRSTAREPANVTRVEPAGEEAAVFSIMGSKSLVRRKEPSTFVPIWSS